jgi:hypothetical protein
MNTTVIPKSVFMYHVARGDQREVFEHEELGLFDVTAMRERAKFRGEAVEIAIDQVEPFVRANRVFEQDRVDQLDSYSWQFDPVLYVLLDEGPPHGTSYLLIDGAHRVIRRHQEGRDTALAVILTEADILRPDLSKWGRVQETLGLDWGAPLSSLKEKQG